MRMKFQLLLEAQNYNTSICSKPVTMPAIDVKNVDPAMSLTGDINELADASFLSSAKFLLTSRSFAHGQKRHIHRLVTNAKVMATGSAQCLWTILMDAATRFVKSTADFEQIFLNAVNTSTLKKNGSQSLSQYHYKEEIGIL